MLSDAVGSQWFYCFVLFAVLCVCVSWFYYLNPLPKAFIAATLPQWPCSADSGSGSGCAVVETLDGVGTKAAYVESFVGGSDGAQYDNLGYLAITLLVLDCAFIAAVTKISFRSR